MATEKEPTLVNWMTWILPPLVVVGCSSINSLCMKYQMTLTVIIFTPLLDGVGVHSEKKTRLTFFLQPGGGTPFNTATFMCLIEAVKLGTLRTSSHYS